MAESTWGSCPARFNMNLPDRNPIDDDSIERDAAPDNGILYLPGY
ncbi:hypothetical protein [Nitrosomonas marina]|nr:hypothetical protein [Nitrosomonas marina]